MAPQPVPFAFADRGSFKADLKTLAISAACRNPLSDRAYHMERMTGAKYVHWGHIKEKLSLLTKLHQPPQPTLLWHN